MKAQSPRLTQQLAFLVEIDKVKHIARKTRLFDGSRFENDAEHSWHVCLMALILSEYSNDARIDLVRVLKMLLVHDLVEIDAGDVIVYDSEGRASAAVRERQAAERVFGMLPLDQKKEFMDLWAEFEGRKTPESKFAAAVDRFEPILQNHLTQCSTWRAHHVTADQLHEKNRHIKDGSSQIWDVVAEIFREAVEAGHVAKRRAEAGNPN